MDSGLPSGSVPASDPGPGPEELRRRLAEYEALLEIGVELASSLDPLRVLALALEKTEELCRAETSSIWEVDPDRSELFFRVVRGRVAGEIRGLRVPLGQGIVGAVAATGRPELVNDVGSDPRWRGDPTEEFHTRAILAVPLIAHGRVLGVLQLLNPVGRSAFTPGDLRRLRLFAGPLAHALDNARLYAEQKRQFVETVTALAEAIEKRDPYTGGHVRRVVGYSLLLGREMGLDAAGLEQLRLGATLHDVGKIAIPDEVLRKPGSLDAGEFEVMKRHTVDGAEIVARVSGLRALIPAVRSHHERLDGKGYPDGLSAEAIPEIARIIAVADAFDAMTTDRPYRRGLAREVAVAEIERHVGSQHAAEVVAAFRRLLERGEFTVDAGERLLVSLSGPVPAS